jgi:hypothetical protein
MVSKTIVLNAMKSQGRADALDLRARAANMTSTEIIAEEEKIPLFDPNKDYSSWAIGSPVAEIINNERYIFTLITPHNASHYPGNTPSNTRALWSLRHTQDPAKARPYIAPLGTSGMYMIGDVCTDPNMENLTVVYRSKVDNNVYAPSEYMDNWEIVE